MRDNIIKPNLFRLDLATARNGVEFDFPCRYLRVAGADGVTTQASVWFNERGAESQAFTLRQGFTIRDYPVSKVFISNTAQPGKYLQLLGFGSPDAADLSKFEIYEPQQAANVNIVGSEITQAVTAEVTEWSAGNVPADIAAQTLPYLTARTSPSLRALPAAGDYVSVGGSYQAATGTNSTVYTVPVGKTLTLDHADVCGWSTSPYFGTLRAQVSAATVLELKSPHQNCPVRGWIGMQLPAGAVIQAMGNSSLPMTYAIHGVLS